MRRLVAGLAIASLFIVVGPAGKAEACSCAPLDPASSLEEADAAFVGTLVKAPTSPTEPDGFTGVWVFEVDEWVKGDLGTQVGVHSALDGAACGFEMAEGHQAGILLYNDEGRPSSGLCSVTAPEALRAATRPLVFDGEGPPVFLLAGETGRTRLVTLDAAGRLLAAAGDDRWGGSVSVCPGGDAIVDIVEGEISIREADTLETVATVVGPVNGQAEQIWCLSPAGDELVALTWNDLGTASRLMVLGESEQEVYSGDYYHVDVGTGHVAVVPAFNSPAVLLISLAGDQAEIPVAGEVTRIEFSPDGSLLLVAEAVHDSPGGWGVSLAVYDTAAAALVFERDGIENADPIGWLSDGLLGIARYDTDDPNVEVIDIDDGSSLEVDLAGWEFQAMGDTFVSFDSGTLTLTGRDGASAVLATLPFPSHRLVAVLDPDATPTVSATTSSVPERGATTEPVPVASPAADDAGIPLVVVLATTGGLAVLGFLVWIAALRRRP